MQTYIHSYRNNFFKYIRQDGEPGVSRVRVKMYPGVASACLDWVKFRVMCKIFFGGMAFWVICPHKFFASLCFCYTYVARKNQCSLNQPLAHQRGRQCAKQIKVTSARNLYPQPDAKKGSCSTDCAIAVVSKIVRVKIIMCYFVEMKIR